MTRAIDKLIEILGDTPVLIGLRQQGHIPTVKRMLEEGKAWDEIGKAIGWDGKAARDWYRAEYLNKPNLVLQETPMIFTVPTAGRYCIGMDYGQASDESVAALMRIGEDGEPDELISILRRDKKTGKWVQECQTK